MVLLEAADDRARATIDAAAFRRMVTAWDAAPPAGLYSPSRYALQVAVTARDAPSALAAALELWSAALGRAGLPEWPLVRTEIVTSDEFERDFLAEEAVVRSECSPLDQVSAVPDPASEDLLRSALHDPVTGLAGRELFLDQVRVALTGAPEGAVRAVMVVDVDGLERPPPEEALVEVAGRLKDAVRRGDLVARVGSAQFALLVTVTSGEDTDLVAERVVGNVGAPILDDGPTLAVTATVGVARTSRGGDADDLLRMAHVAMVAARQAGGERHQEFAARSDSG